METALKLGDLGYNAACAGFIISGPDGAYLFEEVYHKWGARRIDEPILTRSNSPKLGSSAIMGTLEYFSGTPRLTMGRNTASQRALEAAYGEITPEEIFMRVLSARMGENPVPEFDPAFSMEESINRGWGTEHSGIAWYRPDKPELLRVVAYMCCFFPGYYQPYGNVYIPYYVSGKKQGIPLASYDVNKIVNLWQTIPGKEVAAYQRDVFAEQERMEEKAIALINQGMEEKALELVNKFEKEMVDKALKLGEKYHNPLTPIRINCGGPSFIDSAGNFWQADQALEWIDEIRVGGQAITPWFGYEKGEAIATGASIAKANNGEEFIYQTARIRRDFTYSINLLEGIYKLTLKFAEIDASKAISGQRLTNITLNRDSEDVKLGNAVLKIWDIATAVSGINTAIDREYTIGVNRMKLSFVPKPSPNEVTLRINVTGYEGPGLLSGIVVEKVKDVEPFWKNWWKPEDYFGVTD